MNEEAQQQQFKENLTLGIVHACRSLAFFERSRKQYEEARSQAVRTEMTCSEIRKDLERAVKDREAAVKAKAAAEDKQKDLAQSRDH